MEGRIELVLPAGPRGVEHRVAGRAAAGPVGSGPDGDWEQRLVARAGLVPNPKARLKAQFHEVCRFKHLAVRSEEAYLQWIKRFIVFHRGKAEILKAENRNRKAEGNSEHLSEP
jgi:hypothetical protein